MIGCFRKLPQPLGVRALSAWEVALFFVVVFTGCRHAPATADILIIWKEDKAIGWSLPLSALDLGITDSGLSSFSTHLLGHPLPVLGDYQSRDGKLIFNPLIPFTRGLKYEVLYREKRMGIIDLPVERTPDPLVKIIYPTQDTLPENLLKFYLSFSNPMQAGDVLQYIRLIDDRGDTLSNVFLDLQTELWNNDQTQLTLWLNPGRIKRGLQPNLALGPPLTKGHQYQLLINDDWQDTSGKKLGYSYIKSFYVGERDTLSPRIDQWKVSQEPGQGAYAITIKFSEPLDHELLYHCFSVLEKDGRELKGLFAPNDAGTELIFSAGKNLPKGIYRLRIESRQEDLSGNNLNRLFDTDIQTDSERNQDIYYKEFSIQDTAY